MASLPQQELSTVQDAPPKPSEVSLPSPLAAAKESLYSFNKSSLTAHPNSLNHLMSSRSSLKAAHAAFYRDYEKTRSQSSVSFHNNNDDYGYGRDVEEPPVKRRRMQRRNSKTPAMLMAMSSSLLPLDFLEKKDEDKPKKEPKARQQQDDDDDDDDDNWDGGLEIAEELVKHLQTRRSPSGFPSSP